MFLFYVLSFFKKGDTIQGGTLFKGGHYLRKYGMWNLLDRNFQDYLAKSFIVETWLPSPPPKLKTDSRSTNYSVWIQTRPKVCSLVNHPTPADLAERDSL